MATPQKLFHWSVTWDYTVVSTALLHWGKNTLSLCVYVLFVCVAFVQEIVAPQYKDTHIGLTGDSKLAVVVATWYIKSLTLWDLSHH